MSAMELTDAQEERYARHLILDEIGEEGQAKLLASRVLVVGAGGLGSPALLYLAAAGIGTLGIVDDDVVELSNLQRQVLHGTDRLGASKVESAIEQLAEVNPEVRVIPHRVRLDAGNALSLVGEYDLVVDGSDNFATRYVVNDACFLARRTLVAASLLRFEGQLSTFKAHATGPCYRCLHPTPPPAGTIPRCEEAGILGAVAGVMGTLQAAEAVKELLGLGDSLAGTLLIYDALAARFTRIRVAKDPDCPLCGTAPTIRRPGG
jgi:adenylyltransferase/sulfurtransferase